MDAPDHEEIGRLRRRYERERKARLQAESLAEEENLALATSSREVESVNEELRRALAQGNSTLSLLTATLESTADGILVVDAEGSIASFNGKFLEMWGIPDEIIASRDDAKAIAFVLDQLLDPAGFVSKVQELYSQPDAESFDVLEFKDGRIFERYSQPQRVNEQAVGRVWSFRDVTEARKAEAALKDMVEQLKTLDQMKNDFLTAVSHEIRTPLTSVIGYAKTLMTSGALLSPDNQKVFFTRLVANAEKLRRMIEDILDLDRLTRGMVEPRLVTTDVGSLSARVGRESDLSSDGRLIIETETAIARVDPSKIERVIDNLLLNAERYTPPGTPVWLKAAPIEGGVMIIVEDAGPGIPPELREALFEPFRQGPGVPEYSPGVGVGLSTVRRFVDLHKGRVWIDERDGGGASFRVVLPAGDPGDDPAVEGPLPEKP